MPLFRFTITAPATISAQVEIEAKSLDAAQEIALNPSFYEDPENAEFSLDEDNIVRDVYLPDPDDFEIVDPAQKTVISADALAEFWQNSSLVQEFLEQNNDGFIGGVTLADRLVIENSNTDTYAVILPHGDTYGVLTTGSALVAMGKEASVEILHTSADLEDAFRFAISELGYSADDTPTP